MAKKLKIWNGASWEDVTFAITPPTTNVTNEFTTNQVIDTSTSVAALRITQRGSGEALRVEDDTNPDSTPFVIDASGNVGIGVTPTFKLDLTGNTAVGSTAGNQSLIARLGMPDGNGTNLEFTTLRTSAGSTWETAGPRIQTKVDATYHAYIQFNGPVSNGISFGTGGSLTPLGVAERMRIDSAGRITGANSAVLDIALVTNARTASYTLIAADGGKLIEVNSAGATTLTVPTNASVPYAIGTQINILQTGAGQITVAGAGGVTVNATPGLKLRTQWSSATLIKRATDTWVLIGDLSA